MSSLFTIFARNLAISSFKVEENNKSEKNANYSQSISYKLISNEIKTLIDNIIINYIKFLNI